jgi:4-hydroxy-3-methylbut-2-enyl diphosphate reductase
VFRARFGDDGRVGGSGRRDTLCYATQVNQDALSRALAEPLDAAFVIGGKNSSNTYQLFRLGEQSLGERAFFIQSEANIGSRAAVDHYVYIGGGTGRTESRPLWDDAPGVKRVLITGGASCPDGIIQHVITRINSFFPASTLRPVEDVLRDLSA